MSSCSSLYFEEQLYSLIGEFVSVLIKSGDDCCKHKGVICNIEEDFLVLINNNVRTEIIIDSIVGIKKEIFRKDC
ncbi:hypothetical protein [Sporohalobacter salinus]|uniref:hypothetical protein n=1 Tax=Sporohalobacter salinus TaxID=1494606 RepID=UPI0019619027|nr:hypothetical protein [Sporohalobacter salinus]MBM7624222.1 hypothetical protein [Sporohalobacter salinus]